MKNFIAITSIEWNYSGRETSSIELDTKEQFDSLVKECKTWGKGLVWAVLLDIKDGKEVVRFNKE